MKTIDEYIKMAQNMENISDGGSPCFGFDDVVLVKYGMPSKYGRAREGAEAVASIVNEKNAKGVRTPKHLAIKREIIGDNDICWVLQQKATGQSFKHYCNNEDHSIQLEMQRRIANAPASHYEQMVKDLYELQNLGIELKPKNVFYDEDVKDGGFTFIDLLGVYGDPVSGSLKDILWTAKLCGFVRQTGLYLYSDVEPTEEQKQIGTEQSLQIELRTFQAMEKALPNFKQYRRDVLRTYSNDKLKYFAKNGVEVGNLALTADEQKIFNDRINNIVQNSLNKIKSGTHKYWQIQANEIRLDLDNWGMKSSFKYHKKSPVKREDFDSDYDFESELSYQLQARVLDIFNQELIKYVESNNNVEQTILDAYNDLKKATLTY